MGNLTIVPTPIGNLGDITLRALEVLRTSDLILAEDTRTSSHLLHHYDIRKPLESHHKFNEFRTSEALVSRIKQEDLHVALISDAGTPGISDPGSMLVREAIRAQVPVTCLPGPSAMIPALVVSGLSTERFVFEGFLPVKKGRQTRIALLAEEPRTVVLYESPYRVVKTLEEFALAASPDRRCVAVREISKIYEEVCRGTIAELLDHFRSHPPKGEFVLLFEGIDPKQEKKKKREYASREERGRSAGNAPSNEKII